MAENDARSESEVGDLEGISEALMRYSGLCIRVLDLEGRVLEWNSGCESLYGWRRDEVMGSILPNVPIERRASVLAAIRSIADRGEPMERHGLAVTVDGWLLNVAITVIPVFDTEGHVAAVLTVDREELFGEGTDPMSQSTAHHIKRVLGEPIGQIANAATLLARPQVFSDSVQRGRLLSTLKETAREACALIESLSDTMSFEAAQTSEHRALTDVGAMLADVAGLYGTSPGEVMVDFQPEETYAMVDRTAVSRALKAMLRCAVVSSVDGKIRATASLWMPGDVVVQVSYRAVQASDDVGSAGRGGNEVARDAWNGLRYVRAVADGHGGSVDILTGTNGDVTLQMTLPGENKSE